LQKQPGLIRKTSNSATPENYLKKSKEHDGRNRRLLWKDLFGRSLILKILIETALAKLIRSLNYYAPGDLEIAKNADPNSREVSPFRWNHRSCGCRKKLADTPVQGAQPMQTTDIKPGVRVS